MSSQTQNQVRFVQQCASQQRLASGKKYKNQSSMKECLTWGTEDVRQSKDYKKQSINMQHEEELKRYQTKIKKSSSQKLTTEFQDNYKGYVYVPEEQVYVPALAMQNLDYLEGQVYIPAPANEIKFPEKELHPTEMEYNQLKNGTQYRNFYGKLKSENKKELYDVLYDNFVDMYPHKTSYNTKIPRKDLYHVENDDEYQQEHRLEANPDEQRLINLQDQQMAIQEQIQNSQRQLQVQEQLKKEKQAVDLKNELYHLLNEQQKLTLEIEALEKNGGQGFSSYQPIAPAPEDEQRLKQREKRIQRFGEASRELPNSAFTTYYGKPAFANYGNANVSDKNSRFIAGNYLKTHNVNPHRGESKPDYTQTYSNALNLGNEELNPHPPRHRLDEIPTRKELEYHRQQNPFYPNQNELLNQSKKNEVLSQSHLQKVHPLLRKPEQNNQIVIHKHLETKQKESSQGSSQINPQQQKDQSKQSLQSSQKGQNAPILIQNQNKTSEYEDRSPLLPEPHPSVESENQSLQNVIFHSPNQFRQSANNFVETQALQQRQQHQMEQYNKKKEKGNLIVTKVTDIPEMQQISNQFRSDHPIDGMNPPPGYLFSLHENELNPQYYKNINKQQLNRVPYAGKKALVKEDLFEILQHPYDADPVY